MGCWDQGQLFGVAICEQRQCSLFLRWKIFVDDFYIIRKSTLSISAYCSCIV